ncbi:PHP domain-containing protein [Acidianus sp. RZ1]|uniref:PHP-associated domain-containing protein n=1 Tax=Acidianus sp. RZ1 TaxID=1540082 RepID=UPI0014921378|nr:PHP domain-containing protein [Acidianus sp. RZ1]NON61494.1 PHP domain-containing protein [Acidianus sp. RZ1]
MKVDFHVHSNFSDGKEDPKTMVSYAKKKGIFIALTDHDTSKGIERVKEEVIPGQEVTTEFGHVVILCEFPPSPPRKIAELVDYSKENSCFLFPSHPFDIFRKGIGDRVFSYKFDGIEVFNSKAPKKANIKALTVAKSLGLVGLANSDSHVKEAIGSAYNDIETHEFSLEIILEELRKGRVKPVAVGLTAIAKLKIVEWYIRRKI